MKQSIIKELIFWQSKFITYLSEKKRMAKHTVHSYKLDMDAFIYYVEKTEQHLSHTDIPTAMINYNIFLLESNLSKASIARKTSCLRTLCRFLQSEDIIIDITLKRPFFAEKKPVFFDYAQLLQLFDVSEKEKKQARFYTRERAIWELLLATGIRCNEIITITTADLNLEMRSLTIQDTKYRRRVVSFDQRTYLWIKKYVTEERQSYKPQEPYLFLNNTGYKLTSRAIQRSLKLLTRLSNIPDDITPHTLRHSYAMQRLSENISQQTLKELLGLRSTETVEKYFAFKK